MPSKRRPPATPPADAGCLTVPEAVPDGRGLLGGAGLDLPVEAIRPSPFQPRRQFDQAELQQLADTMLSTGLLQPIVVRPIDEGAKQPYELIAGERRLRAAQLAGLKAIPAIVRVMDDCEAEYAAAIENLQRRDLNPIEEARAYRALLDAEPGLTQEQLGQRLGKSQPHVANRLRLLKLPAAMKKVIISGEISPTFARELARWPDHPVVEAAIGQQVAEMVKYDELGSIGDFADRLRDAVEDATRAMSGDRYVAAIGRRVKIPAFSAEEREQLGVVEVPLDWAGKTQERATNAKLWDELMQQRSGKAESGEGKAEGGKGKAEGGKQKGEGGKAEPLTAAQQKAAAAEERRRAGERARQFRRRLWDWYVQWLRYLVALYYSNDSACADALRFFLLVGVAWHRDYQFDRTARLRAILRGHRVKGGNLVDAVLGTANLFSDQSLEVVAGEFAAACLFDLKTGEANQHVVPADDVVRLAKRLLLPAESAWLEEQAGPLSEAYWNLHDKEQLVALGRELAVDLQPGWKKADMIKAFLARRPKPGDKEVGIDMPAELKTIKRPIVRG